MNWLCILVMSHVSIWKLPKASKRHIYIQFVVDAICSRSIEGFSFASIAFTSSSDMSTNLVLSVLTVSCNALISSTSFSLTFLSSRSCLLFEVCSLYMASILAVSSRISCRARLISRHASVASCSFLLWRNSSSL